MLMKRKFKKIHFVGIGGIGMSGIAEVLLNQGFSVSGSDKNLSEITTYLETKGAKIFSGHSPQNVEGADILVYSSAVTPDNPEVIAAKMKKVPIIRRAEMLGELMRLKLGVAIAGTHGKTTTSSMTGLVLSVGKLDPTLIIGGKVRSLNTNSRLGESEYLVAEADEYDRSFLTLTPTIAVITNIEEDHMDCYEDLDDLKNTFITFANKVPFYGSIICCLDSENVIEILPELNKPFITYGFSAQADYQAVNVTFDREKNQFDIIHKSENIASVEIGIPGNHNISNALAAFIVGRELGLKIDDIKKGLAEFDGVMRRFEIKYSDEKIIVIDDYAHHPTEVGVTLEAAKKSWNSRVIAVFQPHLFSRTRDLCKDFGKSFFNSDILIVTDIYPAREEPIAGVSGELIADAARNYGHRNVHYIADKRQIPDFLMEIKEAGDVVVGLGAGDIWQSINDFIKRVKNENT